jgi:hypothetical protein
MLKISFCGQPSMRYTRQVLPPPHLNGNAGAIIYSYSFADFTRFLANKSPYPPFAINFPGATETHASLKSRLAAPNARNSAGGILAIEVRHALLAKASGSIVTDAGFTTSIATFYLDFPPQLVRVSEFSHRHMPLDRPAGRRRTCRRATQ